MKKIYFISLVLLSSPAFANDEDITLSEASSVAFEGLQRKKTDRGEIFFEPKKLVSVGKYKVLISEGKNDDECHACAGAISVHYLVERSDGWHVAFESLTATGGSTWGLPGHWSISNSLLDYPVIYTESGGTWQGCTSTVAEILPLLPTGIGENIIIPIFTGKGGYGPPITVEGVIRDVNKNVGFSVKYSGRSRGKAFNKSDFYRWDGNKFSIDGEPSLETC